MSATRFLLLCALTSTVTGCHERGNSGQPASSGTPRGPTSGAPPSSAVSPPAMSIAKPLASADELSPVFDPRHVLLPYEGPPVARSVDGCFVLKNGETRCLQPSVPTAQMKPGSAGLFYDGDSGCFADHAGAVWCWGKVRAHVVNSAKSCTWETWRPQPEGEERHCPSVQGFYYCGYDQVCAKPARLARLTDVVQLAGRDQKCALRRNGEVWCWGENASFEGAGPGRCKVPPGVRDATPVDVCFDPERVQGIPPLQSIAATQGITCGLSKDGRLFCWGSLPDGYSRQLLPKDDPVGSAPAEQLKWPRLKQVMVTTAFVCGITREDEVFCQNEADELPVRIDGFGKPLEIGGGMLICVRNRDQEVWCSRNPWSPKPLPPFRKVAGLEKAVQLASSEVTSNCAVLEDASAYCWGNWRYRGEHRTWPPMPALP
jgi:alpha-tubulin suppressor-like RCC1 family protein